MDIKAIVADPEWQALRRSLVGTWKASPVENVRRLREYVGDGRDWLRLKRVWNYLTGSGFRLGVIAHPEIDKLVSEVRNQARKVR